MPTHIDTLKAFLGGKDFRRTTGSEKNPRALKVPDTTNFLPIERVATTSACTGCLGRGSTECGELPSCMNNIFIPDTPEGVDAYIALVTETLLR